MKKGLLFIFSAILLCFSIQETKAQDLKADFFKYFTDSAAVFGKTNAKDAFNQWKGKGAAGPFINTKTMKAYVVNRPNNIGPGNEPDDTNPTALRARFDNDACDIVIESSAELAKISLQYRGASDASVGAFQVSYGADATSLATYVFPDVTSVSPGVSNEYKFPIDPFTGTTGVKYVVIKRKPGVQSNLYGFNVTAVKLDADFFKYFTDSAAVFGKTNAKDAFNQWKGKGIAGPFINNQNIKAYVVNRPNNIGPGNEPDDTNPTALRARFDNDACDIVIESPSDLSKIALKYRGASDGSVGAFQVSYGADATSLATYVFPDVTAASPGVVNYYNFPIDPFSGTTGVRYVVIKRKPGVQSNLYGFSVSTGDFVLPLKILSFTAKADAFGKTVNLGWSTSNEVNTKEFIVEKRTDNSDFSAIGSLNSKNTEGTHNYSFVDNDVKPGNAYYRLKQVDNDGVFTYSKVISVNIVGGVSVSLYPNPTNNILNVTHNSASSATIQVFGLDGRSVINQSLVSGSTLTNVDVSQLPNGIYVLRLNNAGKQSSIKFIKN